MTTSTLSQDLPVCVGCGKSHDMEARTPGNWWLAVDRDSDQGVCSNCASELQRWKLLQAEKAQRKDPPNAAGQVAMAPPNTQLQCRPELLRQWHPDLCLAGNDLIPVTATMLRALVADAMVAHENTPADTRSRAARKVAEYFIAHERTRGKRISTHFKHPANGSRVENASSVPVKLLRALVREQGLSEPYPSNRSAA